jgi:hypothetical protein
MLRTLDRPKVDVGPTPVVCISARRERRALSPSQKSVGGKNMTNEQACFEATPQLEICLARLNIAIVKEV